MKLAIIQLVTLIGAAFLLWLISHKIRKVSIIDRFWSAFFLMASLVAWLLSPSLLINTMLMMIPLLLWGVRLSLHIAIRSFKKGEDPRYIRLEKTYRHLGKTWALWIVFLPQVLLAWIINWPITVAIASARPPFSWGIVIFGIVLFVVGFLFESIADAQLLRFQRRRSNSEQVLDQGLWSWSRHPNYFGEAVLWWGFYFLSVGVSGSMLTIFSPILITFLLMKVSGVTMLEELLEQSKPQYKSYIKKTSAFFPWPPKK